MERRVRYSDISNEEIPEGTGARVRIMFFDPSRPDRRLDITDAEAAKLGGQEVDIRPTRRVDPDRVQRPS